MDGVTTTLLATGIKAKVGKRMRDAEGSLGWKLLLEKSGDIEVSFIPAKVSHYLLQRALTNKAGVSRAANGAIVCRVVPATRREIELKEVASGQ